MILRYALQSELRQAASDFGGVLGAQIVDLATGTHFGVNENLVFPQASAIKVPILIELFHQARERPILLEERRPVRADNQVGGSGVIEEFGDGTSALSLADLAVLMVVLSDNTAANMLIDALGMEAVNRTMQQLGLTTTRLQRKLMHLEASARGQENISTPAEAADLMVRIARCQLPISTAGCTRIRGMLEIPKADPVYDAIPSSVPIAFKSGWSSGVRSLWALVDLPDRPFVLTVMMNYAGDDHEKDAAISRVAAAAYDYFVRLANSTSHGVRIHTTQISRSRAANRSPVANRSHAPNRSRAAIQSRVADRHRAAHHDPQHSPDIERPSR